MIVTITENVYPSLRLHSLIGSHDRLDRHSIEPDPSGPGQNIYEVHYGILNVAAIATVSAISIPGSLSFASKER